MKKTTKTTEKKQAPAIVKLDDLKAVDFKLEESEAKGILESFLPTAKEITQFDEEYFQITEVPLEETTPERSEKAKKLRLKLVEKRGTKGIGGIHKKQKDYYLNGGRFVDGIKNTIVGCLETAEEKLEAIEKYEENKKNKAIEEKHQARIKSLEEFEYVDVGTKFGDMPEADWNQHYEFIESSYKKKVEEKKTETQKVENLTSENQELKTQIQAKEVQAESEKEIIQKLVQDIELLNFQCIKGNLKNSISWGKLKDIILK